LLSEKTQMRTSKAPLALINSTHTFSYVLIARIAKLARSAKANSVMYVGEARTARGESVPMSGLTADVENRGDAVMLGTVNV
jgi:hypothetical protein